jgi:transcription factor E2F7/8
LDESAKKISLSECEKTDDQKEQKLKTKIRRLYDIANVLQSIGLIEKCHALNSKKPAFKWVGLHGVITQVNELKELNLKYIKLKKQ